MTALQVYVDRKPETALFQDLIPCRRVLWRFSPHTLHQDSEFSTVIQPMIHLFANVDPGKCPPNQCWLGKI